MAKGYAGSKTDPLIRDSLQTPPYVFHWYNDKVKFTTDVAANWTNTFVPEHHMGIQKNGEILDALVVPWGPMNWCNPPYSDITPWVEKAIEETKKGKATIMLIPADTSVGWFKLAFDNCSLCEFIEGRISFIDPTTGKPKNGNNKGSVVFVFEPSKVKRTVRIQCRKEMQFAYKNKGDLSCPQ